MSFELVANGKTHATVQYILNSLWASFCLCEKFNRASWKTLIYNLKKLQIDFFCEISHTLTSEHFTD